MKILKHRGHILRHNHKIIKHKLIKKGEKIIITSGVTENPFQAKVEVLEV